MKFWLEHFLVVLIENDKKLIEKNMTMFHEQNQVILAWFLTLSALVIFMSHEILT